MAKKKDLKKFRGGIRLESTTAPTDLAGDSSDAGALYFDSTAKGLKVHDGTNFTDVGAGSSGGLDTFYVEDFRATSAYSATGGTCSIIDDADSLSEKSLKYIPSGTSAESFFCGASDITFYKRQKGKTCSISFYYTYDGADDDFTVQVKDNAGTILTSSSDLLKSTSTSKKFVTTFTIPSGATSLQWGIKKTTDAENLSAYKLIIDDVEMSQDPFVEANLLEDEIICRVANSDESSSPQIYTEGDGYVKVTVFNSPVTHLGGGWDSSTNQYTIPETGYYDINFEIGVGEVTADANMTQLVGVLGIGNDSSSVTNSSIASQIKDSPQAEDHLAVKVISNATYFTKGQVIEFRFFVALATGKQAKIKAETYFTIAKRRDSNTKHIITPAKSNLTDWATYDLTTQGFGTISGHDAQWRRVGDSMEIRGTFTAGTPTSDEARIGLPDGYTIDDSINNNKFSVGRGYRENSSSNTSKHYNVLAKGGTTYLNLAFLHYHGAQNPHAQLNGGNLVSSSPNETVHFYATVPIKGWGAEDHNFLAALPMTKWQRKNLVRDVTTEALLHTTTDNSDFIFQNLTEGTYRLSGQFRLENNNSTGGTESSYIEVKKGSSVNLFVVFSYGLTSNYPFENTYGFTEIFTLTAADIAAGRDSVQFESKHVAADDIIQAGVQNTFCILEKLPMHEETDIW